MTKITGILIDVQKQTIARRMIECDNDSNQAFYELLNCRTISCPTRMIEGVKVIVVCDDEGLLKDDPIPAIIGISSETGRIVDIIAGSVFLCKFDGVDDITSLSEKEIERILSAVHVVSDGKETFRVLFSQFR